MPNAEKAIVIKFGGSAATNDEGANKEYLRGFFTALGQDFQTLFSRAAFVIGGGPRVRRLQATVSTQQEKDHIGLRALREHAGQMSEVLREFGMDVEPVVPTNPEQAERLFARQKKFAIALGGLQIGQSTDTVGVTAAELFAQQELDAKLVILSNVWRIFTADPKSDSTARPIRRSSINTLIREGVLIDDPAKFTSGMSVTIDPVATHRLSQYGLAATPVFFGHANDTQSISQFLHEQEPSNGTVLDPRTTKTEYYLR